MMITHHAISPTERADVPGFPVIASGLCQVSCRPEVSNNAVLGTPGNYSFGNPGGLG
jgi:hypothetical protein